MRTPINAGESIIEPFWDPQISQFEKWEVADGSRHGLRVYQNWCWLGFEWTGRPADSSAMEIHRTTKVACAGFDNIIMSAVVPDGASIALSIKTDTGERSLSWPISDGSKQEYELSLDGAAAILHLAIEISTEMTGISAGWINWIGISNLDLTAAHVEQWNRFDAQWEGFLKPLDFEPTFAPQAALLVTEDALENLIEIHNGQILQTGTSSILEAAESAAATPPENMIGEFVNFWTDTRYNRVRDHGKLLIGGGTAAAAAGVLTKDKDLHRLAARYGMSIASCDSWDSGFQTHFRDGPFEHRSFVPSLCLQDLAIILDLAGEWFTEAGRDLILRRMAEEGLGSINFNTWKHDYIFECNQLAWFTPGRILASLILEKTWPRAAAQSDLAISDLTESLKHAILPDGGYPEGPTYFQCVSKDALLPYLVYTQARGLTMSEIVPDSVFKTEAFAELIASTDESSDCIPICDARSHMDLTGLALIAHLMPESQWVRIYRKKLSREGGKPAHLLAMNKDSEIPHEAPPFEPFIQLQEMGPVASVRSSNDCVVKLFVQGNKANAGHAHEDKGSFVLEFAGDTFLMDPGTCDYSYPNSMLLKNCERHNMLVPTGVQERPFPLNPLPFDVKPTADGDEVSFNAEIDLSPGWEGLYKKWIRTWTSSEPFLIEISDDYELARGDGVAFLLNTQLPVKVDTGGVEISGRKGVVYITTADDCEIVLETLAIDDSREQTQIRFLKKGKTGRITVSIEMEKL
ncbi:MAG: hypothetical protein HN368_04085 [Spirochaetales bacterium]|jgi:hypothetical protein|nr:hypothetical protein [Spirochaetales bacterium]